MTLTAGLIKTQAEFRHLINIKTRLTSAANAKFLATVHRSFLIGEVAATHVQPKRFVTTGHGWLVCEDILGSCPSQCSSV